MRIVPLCLLVAACSAPVSERNVTAVDIGNAADAARASVERYRAHQPPAPVAPPPPQADVDEPRAAAQVARRYWMLVDAKRIREARLLWEDAAGADALARLLAHHPPFAARIGTPGRVDAGAGQRHITIPVTLVARRSSDPAVQAAGTMTLHRTIVDGASAAQRGWRIASVTLVPGEAADPVAPPVATAGFRCAGDVTLTVRFDNVADHADITIDGTSARLAGQRPASGIWYRGEGYELRGKGRDVTLTRPGGEPVACRATD